MGELGWEANRRTRPVGPAPNIRTEEPIFGAILSRPWAAQDAGSRSVASTQERFLILNTRPAGMYSQHIAILHE
jgi:hypothetical protein